MDFRKWSERAFLVAFGLYFFIYAVLIPKGIYLRGDDFAYIESVIQSLTQGRIVTHDFIGPYNAFFTFTGVMAYRLTGNFYLSTFGVLCIFAMINFFLFYCLFRVKLGEFSSAALTLLTVTFPFYLHKSVDYHGSLPTWTCFLTALLAFSMGRHLLLMIAIFLAVSTRQNSIVLFVLPVYSLVSGYRRKGRVQWALLFYLTLCLVALSIGKHFLQTNWFNRNLHVIPSDFNLALRILRQFGVGCFLSILFITVASFAVMGKQSLEPFKKNLRQAILPLGLSLLFLGLAFGSSAALVWFQTPLIGSLDHGGRLQWVLKIFILVSIWFFDRQLLNWNAIWLLGLAYLGISSMLGFFWDYYLAEIAILSLWIVLQSLPLNYLDWHSRSRLFNFAFVLIIFGHLGYAYLYKVQFDKQALVDVVFERLERQGKIYPDQMTGATFGFLGFKVFDLIVLDYPTHGFDDFTCYIQGNGVALESALPWQKRLVSSSDSQAKVLVTGTAKIGFIALPYRVVDHQNPEGRDICHGEFKYDERTSTHSRPYPLDNAEWANFINLARAKTRGAG